ncbi:hypothetical protein OG783_20850 [Streptomyces jietaisiensis]|uniref:hypothetical protein n=1 Tax=Streptomyces griseoaurantiacus TaxID=68213 RepID=UPI00324F2787
MTPLLSLLTLVPPAAARYVATSAARTATDQAMLYQAMLYQAMLYRETRPEASGR